MDIDPNLIKAKALVQRALDFSGDEGRYHIRLNSYPCLADLGLLPADFDQIVNDEDQDVCHGLAFRMATYSDGSEYLFGRWEKLLKDAKVLEGWDGEYSNWKSKADHWAKKWDRFSQFLWFLQCVEYFLVEGFDVSFPVSKKGPAPDLCVVKTDEKQFFVECYFFTKWWGRENFLEHLLYCIDKNLRLDRKKNIAFDKNDNPMSSDPKKFVKFLAALEEHMEPKKLKVLRERAEKKTPQLVFNYNDFSIMLEGSGEYQPKDNAHGDPSVSWGYFVEEIVRNKEAANGLGDGPPNILMVNGLGIDFQLSHGNEDYEPSLPDTLDEIRIYTCGIDDVVASLSPIVYLRDTPEK